MVFSRIFRFIGSNDSPQQTMPFHFLLLRSIFFEAIRFLCCDPFSSMRSIFFFPVFFIVYFAGMLRDTVAFEFVFKFDK